MAWLATQEPHSRSVDKVPSAHLRERHDPHPARRTARDAAAAAGHRGNAGLLRTDDRSAQVWGSCDRIRIGVVRSSEGVMTFWTSQGLEATGELRSRHEGTVESEAVYLEKRFS
jgi:hypothetical protein